MVVLEKIMFMIVEWEKLGFFFLFYQLDKLGPKVLLLMNKVLKRDHPTPQKNIREIKYWI